MLMDVFFTNLYEAGPLAIFLSFFEPFIMTFLVYWFMRELLPNRFNIYLLVAISLIYAVWFNLREPKLLGTRYHLLMNIFVNVLTYFIFIFLFKGKFWKRVLVWWYFDTIKMMCQTVSFVPFLLYHTGQGYRDGWPEATSYVESDALLKMLYLMVFLSLFLLLGSLSQKIWRGLLLQKFQPFYLLYLILPLGLKYSLAQVVRPNMGDVFFMLISRFIDDAATAYLVLSLLGIVACLVADAVILYYVFSHEKRAVIEAELQVSRREMELEQARFREVEEKGEELAKIRHDLNNQLMSVIQLARVGENAAAREMIDALAEEINQGGRSKEASPSE
ncbi:hypothetical protein LJC60_04830 [Ruminococcaceae bacterium OttesenSCG-928-D13]|nr:hypothetical protein [Ruminococcaceae bacterium OttesenSCG-928-D13]